MKFKLRACVCAQLRAVEGVLAVPPTRILASPNDQLTIPDFLIGERPIVRTHDVDSPHFPDPRTLTPACHGFIALSRFYRLRACSAIIGTLGCRGGRSRGSRSASSSVPSIANYKSSESELS